jgi:phosphatidylglycerophosphate synthase
MPKRPIFTPTSIHSQWELGLILRFNKTKDKIVSPLITLFERAHIKPATLSIAGIVILFTSFIFSLLFIQPIFFLSGLCLHIILDGLDGPLARRKKISPYGELIDVIADHAGIIITGFAITFFNYASTTITITYLILYTAVIALSLIRNKLNTPFLLIFRPRLLIYLSFAIDYFFILQLTPYLLVLSSCLFLLLTITSTLVLLRLKKTPQP